MSSASSIGGLLIGGVADGLKGGFNMYAANKANKTMENAIKGQQYITAATMTEEQKRAQETRDRYSPYTQQGAQGLGLMNSAQTQMSGYDPTVNYDTEYTDRLKDYESSPAYTAQNSLAQQDLARQQSARGLYNSASAGNASAELSQKLRATDYDKYRADLAQRYGALSANSQLKYQQLSDQFKMGQTGASMGLNAVNSMTGVDNISNNNYQNSMNQMGNLTLAAGQQKANYQTGLGNSMGQMTTLGSDSLRNMGSMGGGGMFGGNSGGGSSL